MRLSMAFVLVLGLASITVGSGAAVPGSDAIRGMGGISVPETFEIDFLSGVSQMGEDATGRFKLRGRQDGNRIDVEIEAVCVNAVGNLGRVEGTVIEDRSEKDPLPPGTPVGVLVQDGGQPVNGQPVDGWEVYVFATLTCPPPVPVPTTMDQGNLTVADGN
jgi:hypothetical protein